MPDSLIRVDTVVLDIDGTLLDSNYHHAVAWLRALAAHGHDAPGWRVHRAIGMGGDRLVAAVAGDAAEAQDGDAIRATWEQEYDAMLGEPRLLPGAVDLLVALRERGLRVALASSAIPRHAQRALDLLDAERLADAWTTSEDAAESKPAPDLVEAAVAAVDGETAVLVGDSVWDVEAAARAGMPAIGVLTGGTSEAELTAAGAAQVVDDVAALLDRLDRVLARG